jgi:predicted ribosome quality control (RQC) complex YloA/Tae2 family protein
MSTLPDTTISLPALNVNRKLNLKSLKQEVSKQYLRAIKKMGKLNEKTASDLSDESKGELIQPTSDNAEVTEMQTRLQKLRELDEGLAVIKNPKNSSFLNLLPALHAVEIDIEKFYTAVSTPTTGTESSHQQQQPIRSPPAPKKPYHVYLSSEGIEIYVGKRAEDNDELSCNPEHREDREWWLHVSDHAGSHVVIKSTDDMLPANYRETVKDACILAAANSKAKNHNGKVTIHLTRCRNVSKPKNAKAGLVHISGDIRAVTIDLRAEMKRLEKLEKIR